METFRTCSICQIVTDDYIQCICASPYCTFHTSLDLNAADWPQQCCKKVLDQFHGIIQGGYDIPSMLGPIAKRIYDLSGQQESQCQIDINRRLQKINYQQIFFTKKMRVMMISHLITQQKNYNSIKYKCLKHFKKFQTKAQIFQITIQIIMGILIANTNFNSQYRSLDPNINPNTMMNEIK